MDQHKNSYLIQYNTWALHKHADSMHWLAGTFVAAEFSWLINHPIGNQQATDPLFDLCDFPGCAAFVF